MWGPNWEFQLPSKNSSTLRWISFESFIAGKAAFLFLFLFFSVLAFQIYHKHCFGSPSRPTFRSAPWQITYFLYKILGKATQLTKGREGEIHSPSFCESVTSQLPGWSSSPWSQPASESGPLTETFHTGNRVPDELKVESGDGAAGGSSYVVRDLLVHQDTVASRQTCVLW